jgi:flagellar hook assembly protein FlgD
LQELDDEQFISQLATLNYTEQIDWSSLNRNDIKELREFLTDECGD